MGFLKYLTTFHSNIFPSYDFLKSDTSVVNLNGSKIPICVCTVCELVYNVNEFSSFFPQQQKSHTDISHQKKRMQTDFDKMKDEVHVIMNILSYYYRYILVKSEYSYSYFRRIRKSLSKCIQAFGIFNKCKWSQFHIQLTWCNVNDGIKHALK